MSAPSAHPAPSDRRLRCLWLTKGLGRGGVERLLVDMFPHVDHDRFAVDVAYVLPWKDNYRAALEGLGARVECLGADRPGDPRWILRLNRLLRAQRYDLVHSHAPLPGVAVRMAPLGGPGPVIVHTEHNMWDRYRWPTRYLNSFTYHRNAHAVAVSRSVADTIRPVRRAASPPVRTIHHGTVLSSVRHLDADERSRRRADLDLPAGGFLVGNVGNFTAKKDHDNLLQAMTGEGPISSAHLVLIGLGPLQDQLQRRTAELGLADRVTFLGSRDDVFELLPLMDAFCLSSRYEGFPIALVEAMATGLPCVATTVGGIPEIVEDGVNGLLVPPGDPDRLGAAIERYLTDPSLARACGEAARESAEKLDLRHAVAELEGVYDEALRTVRR